MTANHLVSEFGMLHHRLFGSNNTAKLNEFSTYTRNGEHNSVIWLVGHIGYIADIFVLKPWNENGRRSLITDANFGFSSNGRSAPVHPLGEVRAQVLDIFMTAQRLLSGDNVEEFLSRQSSYPDNCASDKHLVIHAIQDIAYHLGQLGYVISGKTLR